LKLPKTRNSIRCLESDDDANVETENVYDEVLFGMLKDLTRKVGKQLGLPPYVIFQEPSLGGNGL
jgi:ATP-dependent DNA helicase RecQ